MDESRRLNKDSLHIKKIVYYFDYLLETNRKITGLID